MRRIKCSLEVFIIMQDKWIKRFGYFFVALALGTIVLAACGRTADSASNTTDNPNGLPAVHMNETNFLVGSITIKKGSTLLLVNDVAVPHVIENGTWNNGTQEPKLESGAPKVDLNF